jgi:hypothetical protein
MITVYYPNQAENCYAFIQGSLVGPFSVSNSTGQEINIQLPTDFLWQHDGSLHGEKGVTHLKGSGHVSYSPIHAEPLLEPAPYDTRPLRIKWTAATAANPFGSKVGQYADWGVLTDASYTTYRSGSMVRFHVGFTGGTGGFSRWELGVLLMSGTKIDDLSETRISDIRVDGMSVRYRLTTTSYFHDFGYRSKTDYSQESSLSEILADVANSTRSSVSTSVNYTAPLFVLNSTFGANRTAAESAIGVALAKISLDQKIEEAHYGDLAMRALASVNKVDSNMIAFIRDLKDIKSLIPKLSNLLSLKTWSGNYLAFKYGVLPTIDDVNNIVAAVKGRLPYLDKNGYRTYSAGHRASVSENDVLYEIEQHLKVAIDQDDSGLTSLVNRLETIGLFPSWEYIWDLIPYSFVLDWLVDVGELLQRVDANLRLLRYDIKYTTMSRKMSGTTNLVASAESPYIGTISLVSYHRWVSGQCPETPLSLNPAFLDFDHWIEASALIIQRSK